jgi:two-component system, OmpR family, phosphate regulon sensor histidine kinase PhoR
MVSLRSKILISFVVAFTIIISLTFPFAASTVRKISYNAMEVRSEELIAKLQTAPNNDALVRRLKEQKALFFFRISVITDERKVLYDSHTKRLLGSRFSQEYTVDHPEVLEAFKNGVGYSEDYSELLGQRFSYFAKTFDFHGKIYVLRTAFPYKYVTDLTNDFEIGIIGVTTIILLLFSTMTWFIINYLTKPIQLIVNAVRPYQEGKVDTLPKIKINSGPSDEFHKLAETLNSLSTRIQKHIEVLTIERNEKRAILESLVEGVIAVDNYMIITYTNQSALNVLNIDHEDSLIHQEFTSELQPKCYQLLRSCQQLKKPLTDTLEIQREGPKIYLDIVAAPKKGNTGAILVLQDKTSHYRLLEMRKDFIANASHELKTPITIIRGFAETLHDNPDLSEEIRVSITEKIVRNCKRMTNLIKDFLTLADIEKLPESRLSECDLVDMIINCTEMIKNVHPNAQIQMTNLTQGEILLNADHSLLELAFMNLIENAAKYSIPPAQIEVTLEDLGKVIRIKFIDQGIGIPVDDIDHVFERFYTVDKAHSQKMGGSGLGLSIVKTIIDKHHGKIYVSSKVGIGSTFTVTLPRRDV